MPTRRIGMTWEEWSAWDAQTQKKYTRRMEIDPYRLRKNIQADRHGDLQDFI